MQTIKALENRGITGVCPGIQHTAHKQRTHLYMGVLYLSSSQLIIWALFPINPVLKKKNTFLLFYFGSWKRVNVVSVLRSLLLGFTLFMEASFVLRASLPPPSSILTTISFFHVFCSNFRHTLWLPLMTWLFVLKYQKHISKQGILSLGGHGGGVIP